MVSRSKPRTKRHINGPALTLATDLDGTFLHGSRTERQQLYSLFHRRPDHWRLIFVTGRGIESIQPLLTDPIIPKPDYIIGDVGATVIRGNTLEPVHPLQGDIERKWPGIQAVLEATRHLKIQRQDVPQERRCSFYVEPHLIPEEIEEIADGLDCDVLYSADYYLDFLPRGVNKGWTLQRLVEIEGIDPDSVFVAGDTLNDLSLFESPYRGVVVGNAEKPLLKALRKRRTKGIYFAERPGTAGIVEAIVRGGFQKKEDLPRPPAVKRRGSASSQLVVVYHRLPFQEEKRGNGRVRVPHKSPNGIIPTLLRFFAGKQKGLWVAWSESEDRRPDPAVEKLQADGDLYPHLKIKRVWLTAKDVEIFYQRFSKEAFWPILHSFTDHVDFNQEHWRRFVEINHLFAEKIAETAEPGALIWLHDYNLWMVTGKLRELRPDLRIAFFHHTPFPAAGIFSIIPWRAEIISSLLHCDYIGFHIPRYVENFLNAVRAHGPVSVSQSVRCAPRYLTYRGALGSAEMPTRLRTVENDVHLGAHPVGIDVDLIRDILKKPAVQKKIERLREQFRGRTSIISVERLDYTKGPLEKLKAYELLLEQNPELRGHVSLVAIWTPPNPGMKVYAAIRSQVDQAVGRINGRFAQLDWIPVRYFFRSFPFDDVVAHYAAADVGWVTPLRDGLNLVAKEYVAARGLTETRGVLVLSEFAGCSVELHGALLTNPYDVHHMAYTLKRAIELSPETQELHMKRLFQIVASNDLNHWSKDFLSEVHKIGA